MVQAIFSFIAPQFEDNINRWSGKDNAIIRCFFFWFFLHCPEIIHQYNTYMGGTQKWYTMNMMCYCILILVFMG